MESILGRWSRAWCGLLICAGLNLGCSRGTSEVPQIAEEAPAAPTTAVSANYASRYNQPQNAPEEPALAHVKLPTVTHAPTPFVILNTSQGPIKLRLDAERAPRTVFNFISYVNAGHYTDTIFHQVEKGYALVGGGYTEDLTEKPVRYPIPSEANNGLKNRKGTIAMARQINNPDSATCQFIINLADNPALDYQGQEAERFGFCVFGEVVEGWETIEKIAAAEVKDHESFARVPVKPITVQSVQTMR